MVLSDAGTETGVIAIRNRDYTLHSQFMNLERWGVGNVRSNKTCGLIASKLNATWCSTSGARDFSPHVGRSGREIAPLESTKVIVLHSIIKRDHGHNTTCWVFAVGLWIRSFLYMGGYREWEGVYVLRHTNQILQARYIWFSSVIWF